MDFEDSCAFYNKKNKRRLSLLQSTRTMTTAAGGTFLFPFSLSLVLSRRNYCISAAKLLL